MDHPNVVTAAPNPGQRSAGAATWLVSRRGVALAVGLIILTLFVFRLFPVLDLDASSAFYGEDHHFVGDAPVGDMLRGIFYPVPMLVALVMVGLYLVRRYRAATVWAPDGRGVAFLLLSLALGPGLLVNVVLKDHSHRPRPVQTASFGGTLPFRPVGSFDGACARNCSFVSGEGASSFWTVSAALLAPPQVQGAALMMTIGFGAAASLLRMAFGGHYLSDTIMAALLVWLVMAGTWWAIMRGPIRKSPA